MTVRQSSSRCSILYSSAWATLAMAIFLFFSGLFGQGQPRDIAPVKPPGQQQPLPPGDGSVPSQGGSEGILRGKTIVVDPGHGGNDPGAVGVGPTTEAQNVLAIAWDLKGMLEYAGANVIMTRQTDVNPARGTSYQNMVNGQLAVRTARANRGNADIFVSIHNDWNNNRSISGTTTYYYFSHDYLLADSIQKSMLRNLGSRNHGVRQGNFYVLRNTTMPSALVEVGFLSNAREAELLSQPWYRLEAARGIYYGIVDYFAKAN